MSMQKGDRRIINGWAFYDWANSVYPLVINTAIFPIYYSAVAGDSLQFLGVELKSASLYSFTLALSYLVVVVLSPFLSGIADYTGNKKRFMQFFCYLGALSCCGLFLFSMQNLYLGLLFVMTASIGWSGSLVFYNAYLPEIAEPEDHDRVSAKGFSMGYVGSVLLLLVNLIMILFPSLLFDVEGKVQQLALESPTMAADDVRKAAESYYTGVASRISFIMVGIWWIGFSQVTFARLPNNVHNRKPEGNPLWMGFKELKQVWRQLQGQRLLKRYLGAFFVYSMAVQTVMLMASIFGEQEVNMTTAELITTVLIIQLVAIPGAYGFAWLSKRMGNFNALKVAIAIWVAVCIGAYFVHVATEFYVIATVVGLIMGGTQSLSRSTYSKYLPETEDHASYFSFFDICEKLGIVIGMGT
ncbi:MAG: MFS transporter, partial [Bacteroidota bacterium]